MVSAAQSTITPNAIPQPSSADYKTEPAAPGSTWTQTVEIPVR